MADTDRERPSESDLARVSDAIAQRWDERTLSSRLLEIERWLLIDVSRRHLIAGLAFCVFVITVVVGVFGPASIQRYLLDGTPISGAYIELQPGVITAITIVLGINQLVLSPEFGSIGQQRQRLEDVLSHRRDVEESADVISSPTNPAGFLQTITDGAIEHLLQLDDATRDGDDGELQTQLTQFVEDLRYEIGMVSDGLEAQQFRHVELFGVAIHFDTTRHVHRIYQLCETYKQELSDAQLEALDELLTTMKQFDVAREYFRTRYLQMQFIQFSRAMLYTGLPGFLVAHYSVGIIGPDVLPGTTFAVSNLLWFESGTFTIVVLPILVIISYVARIITLAETSIFIGPFFPHESGE